MSSDTKDSNKIVDYVWSVLAGLGIAFLVIYILTVTSTDIHFIYEGF